LSAEGKPAGEIKLFAWAPGCRIETFDIPLQALDAQESYSCTPLSTVTLVGQIDDATLARRKRAEIHVDYLAGWACDFFGLADCMVPQISLGTANVDANGGFEIDLPNFAADPIASDSKFRSQFQLVLREVKTWNPIAFLSPESRMLRTPGGALRPATSYPQLMGFVARRTR
jgi:hypothetical protein